MPHFCCFHMHYAIFGMEGQTYFAAFRHISRCCTGPFAAVMSGKCRKFSINALIGYKFRPIAHHVMAKKSWNIVQSCHRSNIQATIYEATCSVQPYAPYSLFFLSGKFLVSDRKIEKKLVILELNFQFPDLLAFTGPILVAYSPRHWLKTDFYTSKCTRSLLITYLRK